MKERVFLLFVLLSLFGELVDSFGFTLKAGTRKCFTDMSRKDELFKGEYEISQDQTSTVGITIYDIDAQMHILYTKENATKGKFAFSFDRDGMYDMCFDSFAKVGSGADRIVNVRVKRGAEAKNYNDVANAEKLAPRELELIKIMDQSDELMRSLYKLIHKGEDQRETNESTSSRILYLGVFLTLLMLMLTSGQLFYLHRFFAAKKLI